MTKLKIIFALGVFICFLSGCVTVPEGETQPTLHSKFTNGRRLPSAEGEITVSSTSRNTNSIDIVVKHLVRPQRLNPKARNYVVWEVFNGAESKPQSVGSLTLDKNFTGRLQTATPFRNFELFITAEPTVAQVMPTGEQLFWTSISH